MENNKLNKLSRNPMDKKDEGFAGTLRNIQLNDLIQMCCLAGSSMSISVSKGAEQGIIYICEGEVFHATCGNIVGEEAFYTMLGWDNGKFETLKYEPGIERTIENRFQCLLMESARRADESALTDPATAPVTDLPGSSQSSMPLRIMVVDDSKMMCKIISDILTFDEDIEVVGVATNGQEALSKIEKLKPDLITLDVNMPVMDGSTALKHIMIRTPCPVVIISSISSRSWLNIFDILCLGAVDFIDKPAARDKIFSHRDQIIKIIRHAASAQISNFQRTKMPGVENSISQKTVFQEPCQSLVVICSGSGGYAELVKVLANITIDDKTCVISLLPIPDKFVDSFAKYLDKRCAYHISPLENGSRLWGGTCHVGSVNIDLELARAEEGPGFSVRKIMESGVEPGKAGDVFDLFLSTIAELFPGKIMVVLLSGAEMSGVDSLGKIKTKDCVIISQKPDTCLLPENLEKVIASNLVDLEKAPLEIAGQINEYNVYK